MRKARCSEEVVDTILSTITLDKVNKMKPFTKLFSSIVTSSIWTEDAPTKVVWVTMLALADADGDVWASVGGLARAAGVTREQCADALARFAAPDPDSRTKDNEGRRIVAIDGGWRLLNYKKYREMGRAEDRREYFAGKKREQRARPQMSTDVHRCPQTSTVSTMSTDIEAEAEAEAEADVCSARAEAPTISADSPSRWPYERNLPWASGLVAAGCKIGAQNWPTWKSLAEKHGNTVVLAAAQGVDAKDRWPDSVEKAIAVRGAQSGSLNDSVNAKIIRIKQ